ncbi:helix-turn-helix domain-containing protein [Variovorax paradoxus]|uniref:helix-turn-helix domain-containing protein n=1 Tax=Variovorax paradoxus TaxID=34073 RepID=UPI001DE5FF68|nr:helix-turn-helix domain-containing protein [Variovorax paradoxus]MBW8718484.1 AraC family transcriptional regulator [Variovorax paradoxus]
MPSPATERPRQQLPSRCTKLALLRSTRRNVGDICMEVGYQSEAAFGRAFKRHMAEMSGQYRRRQKGTP